MPLQYGPVFAPLWPADPITHVFVSSVRGSGDSPLLGYLVVGVSPRLEFDAGGFSDVNFFEAILVDSDGLDFDDLIASKLFLADAQQLSGVHPVSSKKSVEGARGRVSVYARAAYKNLPPTAPLDERGVQTGRSRTDNDDVVYRL